MSNWFANPGGALPERDVAKKFDGSNGETVSGSNIGVVAESIAMKGATTSRAGDNGTDSSSSARGLEINPNVNLDGVKVTVSANVSGATRAALVDSGGTLITEQTGLNLSPGDVVLLEASLTAGTNYNVVLGAGGATYTLGENSSASYPYTGSDLDITAGGYSGGTTHSSYAWNIVDVTGIRNTATAYIEWPHPGDVFSWFVATFQRTLDGETVDIYIEEYDGSSWTTIAGPINRGDEITALPGNNVRIKAKFSRASPTKNPTLDLAARSHTV